MQKKREAPEGIWYCIAFAAFCPLVIIIGAILLMTGGLTSTEFNGDFAGYRGVPCTVVASKVIDNGGAVPIHVGIAAVSIASIPFDVAAIRQTNKPPRGLRSTTERARSVLDVTVGKNYTCGLSPTAEPAPYDSAAIWPLAGVAVVGFDQEFAQSQLQLLDDLLIAGIVLTAVGGGVILVAAALYFIARDCNCDCDCDCCGCCSDYYEQYMLERRINSSGAAQNAKVSADFNEDGLLKNYTCKYGAGACCTLFLSRLCGRRAAASEAAPAVAVEQKQDEQKEDIE